MDYIFVGAGSLVGKLLKKWRRIDNKFLPVVILDNDPNKIGTKIEGILIDSVENIKSYFSNEVEIIITTSFVEEIRLQLSKLNITNNITDYLLKDKEFSSQLVARNIKLKNTKSSERCFVIGNGPSLDLLDLNLLKNEDKIMVNHFYKSEELLKLQPNYWMLADPLFWIEEEIFLKPIVNVLETDLINTKLLIKDESLEYLNMDITGNDNIHYYHMGMGNDYEDSVAKIDFTGKIPKFAQNVISTALMLSLDLGYKEIILLGCDHTWWNYSKEEIEGGVLPPHIYSQDRVGRKFGAETFKKLGFSGTRESIERQKYEYLELNKNAENNNMKIYNATPGGYLDIFERIEYNALFEQG